MQGRFARRNLLSFGAGEINGTLTLRRKDNGKTVAVSLNAALQPFAPQMRDIMPKAVGGSASAKNSNASDNFGRHALKHFDRIGGRPAVRHRPRTVNVQTAFRIPNAVRTPPNNNKPTPDKHPP